MPAPFIFIITGEPSGDALGAGLIAALRERVGPGLRVAGIGGERMREQGMDSLVPLADLAVAGIAEVLPRAPVILRHVRRAIAAVRAQRPDAVVTMRSVGSGDGAPRRWCGRGAAAAPGAWRAGTIIS